VQREKSFVSYGCGSIFWEDQKHTAFLSIDPNTPGFSLVVPKTHHASDILKMSDVDLRDFIIFSDEQILLKVLRKPELIRSAFLYS
jgi:diadenosine tetraphosphate (Ap4A) HIT family hydrolase